MLDHIQAKTRHARRGAVKNAFTYGVDFVLTDLSATPPWPISRNSFNLWSLNDIRHGGPRGAGRGLAWFTEVLTAQGVPTEGAQLLLLTQPSFLWFHFNPVSFWFAFVKGQLIAFVAEVDNTFGDRHCYFCAHDDFRPILKGDTLTAQKLMHVSPFQTVEGRYCFNVAVTDSRVEIRIYYENADQGVIATLWGDRRPATSRSLLWAALRRPLGAARVLALIFWQAAILRLKGAPYLSRPHAPEGLVSGGKSAGKGAP